MKIETRTNMTLMSAMQVHRMVRDRVLITDECAASIASWWHGPSGHGATFSRLSHGIKGGVTLDELEAAVAHAMDSRARDDGYVSDGYALEALLEWGVAKVNLHV